MLFFLTSAFFRTINYFIAIIILYFSLGRAPRCARVGAGSVRGTSRGDARRQKSLQARFLPPRPRLRPAGFPPKRLTQLQAESGSNLTKASTNFSER